LELEEILGDDYEGDVHFMDDFEELNSSAESVMVHNDSFGSGSFAGGVDTDIIYNTNPMFQFDGLPAGTTKLSGQAQHMISDAHSASPSYDLSGRSTTGSISLIQRLGSSPASLNGVRGTASSLSVTNADTRLRRGESGGSDTDSRPVIVAAVCFQFRRRGSACTTSKSGCAPGR